MKTIYFVQHGLANNKEIDIKRGLSDIGREQTSKVALYLKKHNIVINKICHSGKLRASETAAVFSEVLSVSAINVSTLNCILPNDDPEELINVINSDAVMYIGHLPHLQKVLNLLLCNDLENSLVKLQNSGVACVEITATTAILKWFVTVDMC